MKTNFFNKKLISKKFNAIILFLILLLGILPIVAKNIYFEKFFIKNLDYNNYYNALYGTSNIGCSTINYIKPEVLFIGDSIGYRAWDLDLFNQKINKSVGSCFLPSFTEHSFQELIRFIKKKIKPEFIILTNTYRTFGLDLDTITVESHKKILEETDKSEYEKAFKLFTRKMQKKKFFKITHPIKEETQEYIKNTSDEVFDSLVEIIIKKNLRTSGIGTYKEAKIGYVENIRILKKYENIKIFCNYLKNNNIKFIMTDIPYSPPIKNLNLNKHFKNNQIVINYFKKCLGNNFFYIDIKEFVTKNKNYVFTNFINTSFKNFESFLKNQKIVDYSVSYFDYDHMNRYGAKIFTSFWINKNKNLFKNENR